MMKEKGDSQPNSDIKWGNTVMQKMFFLKENYYSQLKSSQAEVERLQQDLKIQTDATLEYEKMVQGLGAEVERLKIQLIECADQNYCTTCGKTLTPPNEG